MVLFTTAVGALGLERMQDLNQTLHTRITERLHKQDLARRGLQLIEENARASVLILVGNPALSEGELAVQKRRSVEIRALYGELDAVLHGGDERAIFADLTARRAVYLEHRSEAQELLATDRKRAQDMFEHTVLPDIARYVQSWSDLVALESARVTDAIAAAAADYARTRSTTIALVVTAALLGTLVAFIVTRRIVRPLHQVARAAELLEKNRPTEQLVIDSSDELGTLARAFNLMSEAVRFRQERLEREMNLAQRIQTALLPRAFAVPGLEVAAAMRPATEVGGDYYDVLPVSDGCWFGIGDVAGHGLESGLLMLMIQSSIITLVRDDLDAAPRDVIAAVNRALYENLRERLHTTSFATLVLLRYQRDGSMRFAGGHDELVVWRAGARRCELVETPGAWVGGTRNIEASTVESSLQLHEGDVMVLMTDGVIEARNAEGEEFGIARVCLEIEHACDRPVEQIRDRLLAAVASWERAVEDDASVIVIRRAGREPA